VDAVAGAVGDVDAGHARAGRNWCKHQQEPHLPKGAEGFHGHRAPIHLVISQGTQQLARREFQIVVIDETILDCPASVAPCRVRSSGEQYGRYRSYLT
jgi:hypothetical protein